MAEVTNRRAICGAAHELWMPTRPNIIKAAATQRRLEIHIQESTWEPVKIQFPRLRPSFSSPTAL